MSKKQPKRRFYPDELKRDAIDLVEKQGYSLAEAARSLGIRPNLISRWRREQAERSGEAMLAVDEQEELKTLRREVRQLREEAAILKKAAAYFAQKMP